MLRNLFVDTRYVNMCLACCDVFDSPQNCVERYSVYIERDKAGFVYVLHLIMDCLTFEITFSLILHLNKP